MRTIVTLLLFLPALLTLSSQEPGILIYTQDHWPPGKNVPVTIEILKGEAVDFARLFHSLPTGFYVENVNSGEGEFFWDNNQVNYVWTDLPDKSSIRVQYLARADQLLAGTFRLQVRFDYVLNGDERRSVYSDELLVMLDKNAEVENTLPEAEKNKSDSLAGGEEIKTGVYAEKTVEEVKQVFIDFRIQVSIASAMFSQEELEDRINCRLRHGIKVLKTGSMYKYQSGSFESYAAASEYLKELKAGGVEDAFIVAFRDNVQISIKEAREILGNK
ncbi:MAG: SPOR domain-containing protein [Marinilabiliaceae bacterium]|jgi:hypothetical protein|nr:SPOR domain-containing protein [Marinilabiliaceae bacterium]